jgi:N-acylneuraminate cytidylyltransferase
VLEVNEKYEAQNQYFDFACCLYPTAPFTSSALLINAYKLLDEKNYDTVFPVVAFDYPIQRSLQIDPNGKIEMVWPEFLLSRSQDLPKRYHDTGLFYWYRPSHLKLEKKLFGENAGALVISELECHDIDSPEDWEMAELKYRRLTSQVK